MLIIDRRPLAQATTRRGARHIVTKPSLPDLGVSRSLRLVSTKTAEKQAVLNAEAPASSSDTSTNGNIVESWSTDLPAQSLVVNSNSSDVLPLMWERNAATYGDAVALEDPHRIPGKHIKVTYKELVSQMLQLGAGMKALGLKKGERVSLFAENSSRWIVTDQAVMMNGAVSAVRGSSAPYDELAYIANHSESVALLLHDLAALKKMAPALMGGTTMKFAMVMWTDAEALKKEVEALGLSSVKIVSFEDVMALGDGKDFSVAKPAPSDLATLCYTSGTTGHPKGVMLSHANLMYQVRNLRYFVPINPGETVMSLLPPWHIYERSAGYFMLGHGLCVVYSTIPKFGQDLAKYRPNYFVSVPLVLDTLHGRVMSKLKATHGVKGKVAMFLVAASIASVRNQRVIDGLALTHALKTNTRSLGTLILAVLSSLALKPLHWLAKKIVFGKD